MNTLTKICGLRTPETVDCAVEAGASMVGFVFFPPSPRSISIADASTLAARVPVGIKKVALTVNADDDFLREITKNIGIDIFQLHGNEQPERVFEIRHTFGLPVIKALPVDDRGGNATAFDWSLLKGFSLAKPWLLAGGLTPQNVSQAVEISGAQMVDVSSGVESAPGVKNLDKIRSFLRALEIK
jgi:phosphoribosylanthranilate isomerase